MNEVLDDEDTAVTFSGKGPLNDLMLVFTVHKLLRMAKVELATNEEFAFVGTYPFPLACQ